jgi:hypothetical protein
MPIPLELKIKVSGETAAQRAVANIAANAAKLRDSLTPYAGATSAWNPYIAELKKLQAAENAAAEAARKKQEASRPYPGATSAWNPFISALKKLEASERAVAEAAHKLEQAQRDAVSAGSASRWSPAISAAKKYEAELQKVADAEKKVQREQARARQDQALGGAARYVPLGGRLNALNTRISDYRDAAQQRYGALADTATSAGRTGLVLGGAGVYATFRSALTAGELHRTQKAISSYEGGDKLFEDLKGFDRRASFANFKEAAEGAQSALSQGFKTNEIIPLFDELGDGIAKAGKGMPEFNNALRQLAQIRGKGVASAQDLHALAEGAGLPIGEILKKQFGDERYAKILSGDEPVKAEEFFDAFNKGMKEFSGGYMAATMNELPNQIANLESSWQMLSAEIGEHVVPVVGFLTQTLSVATNVFRALPGPVKGFIGVGGGFVSVVLLLAGAMGMAARPLLDFISLIKILKDAVAARKATTAAQDAAGVAGAAGTGGAASNAATDAATASQSNLAKAQADAAAQADVNAAAQANLARAQAEAATTADAHATAQASLFRAEAEAAIAGDSDATAQSNLARAQADAAAAADVNVAAQARLASAQAEAGLSANAATGAQSTAGTVTAQSGIEAQAAAEGWGTLTIAQREAATAAQGAAEAEMAAGAAAEKAAIQTQGAAGGVSLLSKGLQGLQALVIPMLLIPIGTMVVDEVAKQLGVKDPANNRTKAEAKIRGDQDTIDALAGREKYDAELKKLEGDAEKAKFQNPSNSATIDKKLNEDKAALEKRYAEAFSRRGFIDDSREHMKKYNDLKAQQEQGGRLTTPIGNAAVPVIAQAAIPTAASTPGSSVDYEPQIDALEAKIDATDDKTEKKRLRAQMKQLRAAERAAKQAERAQNKSLRIGGAVLDDRMESQLHIQQAREDAAREIAANNEKAALDAKIDEIQSRADLGVLDREDAERQIAELKAAHEKQKADEEAAHKQKVAAIQAESILAQARAEAMGKSAEEQKAIMEKAKIKANEVTEIASIEAGTLRTEGNQAVAAQANKKSKMQLLREVIRGGGALPGLPKSLVTQGAMAALGGGSMFNPYANAVYEGSTGAFAITHDADSPRLRTMFDGMSGLVNRNREWVTHGRLQTQKANNGKVVLRVIVDDKEIDDPLAAMGSRLP